MFIFLFAMSYDAPGSASNPNAQLTRILMFVVALGLLSIIPVLAYFGYGAIQQGQFARAIFIMSFVAIPFLSYYLYKMRPISQKTKIEMEEKRLAYEKAEKAKAEEIMKEQEIAEAKAKKNEMAKAAIRFIRVFRNEEKGMCTIAIDDAYEYNNLSVYVYLRSIDQQQIQANGKQRIYTKWKKDAPVLSTNQAIMLDFNNLDDNEAGEEYWAEIQSEYQYLTSFTFQKQNGSIKSLELLA
jgi:ABC-type multidrug transport system fused ATPase/permease subunit